MACGEQRGYLMTVKWMCDVHRIMVALLWWLCRGPSGHVLISSCLLTECMANCPVGGDGQRHLAITKYQGRDIWSSKLHTSDHVCWWLDLKWYMLAVAEETCGRRSTYTKSVVWLNMGCFRHGKCSQTLRMRSSIAKKRSRIKSDKLHSWLTFVQ